MDEIKKIADRNKMLEKTIEQLQQIIEIQKMQYKEMREQFHKQMKQLQGENIKKRTKDVGMSSKLEIMNQLDPIKQKLLDLLIKIENFQESKDPLKVSFIQHLLLDLDYIVKRTEYLQNQVCIST